LRVAAAVSASICPSTNRSTTCCSVARYSATSCPAASCSGVGVVVDGVVDGGGVVGGGGGDLFFLLFLYFIFNPGYSFLKSIRYFSESNQNSFLTSSDWSLQASDISLP